MAFIVNITFYKQKQQNNQIKAFVIITKSSLNIFPVSTNGDRTMGTINQVKSCTEADRTIVVHQRLFQRNVFQLKMAIAKRTFILKMSLNILTHCPNATVCNKLHKYFIST